jgi:hypothetical protein
MHVEHSGLSFEAPEGWIDGSTITFTMPPSSLAAPMAMKKTASRPAASVSVTWQEVDARVTPEAYLEKHRAALAQGLEGFQLAEKSKADIDGAVLEYRFETGGLKLLQMLVARRVGPRIVCVTGTALDVEYVRQRDRFLEVARSLR